MELKDYFYDFSDNGFTIDIEDNVIKGKYKGNIDSVDILDTFLEVVTKIKTLLWYCKTSFYNTKKLQHHSLLKYSISLMKIQLRLHYRPSNTKLILNVVNYNYSPGYLTLYCIDILNNKKVSVGWNYSFRIGSRIGKIDLVNVEKVLKIYLTEV
jgi:hypothetical protein